MWPKHLGVVYNTYKNTVKPDGGGICVYSSLGIVTASYWCMSIFRTHKMNNKVYKYTKQAVVQTMSIIFLLIFC